MLTVIQVVREARVDVEEQCVGQIGQGLLILCGFEPSDTRDNLSAMLDKCLNYRIFNDEAGKMNLSLKQVEGGLLLVPQFTLLADTRKGLRPSFSHAAPPAQARALFEELVSLATQDYALVERGEFGANMQVHLCNNGPVTFVMKF